MGRCIFFLVQLAKHVPLICIALVRALPNPFRVLSWKAYERWLITFRFPAGTMGIVNDTDLAQEILKNKDGDFPKSRFIQALLQPLIGQGLFGQPGGTEVQRLRKSYYAALREVSPQRVDDVAARLTREYLRRWQQEPQGFPAPLEFSRLAIDIVTECVFERRFAPAQSLEFVQAFSQYNRSVNLVLLMYSSGTGEDLQPLVRNMGLVENGRVVREHLRRCFVQPFWGENALAHPPFYAKILLHWQSSPQFVPGDLAAQEFLLDEIAVMVLAGHETTASVLSWIFWELSAPERYAAYLQSVRDDGLEQAQDGLIDEGLRLYPPIGVYLRDTSCDVELRGKKFPRGSTLAVSPWTMHRHKSLWKSGREFCPERWRKPMENAESPTVGRNFLPYGSGNRVCPGNQFAQAEMRAILREMLTVVQPQRLTRQNPRPMGSMTTRPHIDFRLRLIPLDGA